MGLFDLRWRDGASRWISASTAEIVTAVTSASTMMNRMARLVMRDEVSPQLVWAARALGAIPGGPCRPLKCLTAL